ncbi:MAG TPA: glycine zipper family protein [Casimicrobiaceae bacterium]
MRTRLRYLLPLAAALVLAGCVTVPTGPAVMALPGTGKSFDAFRADDISCRQYAQSSLGPVPGQPGANAAAANALGGAALGAAAGAILGSVSGEAGHGAAIGAGTGLLVGSAAGANAAGYSSYHLQRTYDAAYLQCMYAKGNQVPAGPRYYGPRPYYGPPPGPYLAPPAG